MSKFPQDSRKTTIDFCDIGEGNTPEEVSRLFLSSLMLANAQNVEIGCSAPKNEALPMDQVSYYLVLNKPFHVVGTIFLDVILGQKFVMIFR